MSDLRKWLKIMESVPPVIATAPEGIGNGFKRDATVLIDPRAGGGVGRFMNYTTEGNAMIDIKGVAREFSKNDFSIPERDLENGNDWFHMSTEPDTEGRMNDKPEFRPGDMIKIADVYGAVIGPGFGVFVGYGTTGEDCIVLFDGKQIVVPIENVASVLEQDAKDNFDDMDNDGNLSPMSFGSDNVKIEQPQNSGMQSREPAMDTRDEFSKWMSAVEEALSSEGKELAEDIPSQTNECGCGSWDCPVCFPAQDEMPGMNGALDGIGGVHPANAVVFGGIDMNPAEPTPPNMPQPPCSACSGDHQDHDHAMDTELQMDMNDIAADEMELEEVGMFDEDPESDFLAKGGKVTQLPYLGGRKERQSAGKTMGSKHIGTLGGKGTVGQVSGMGANLSTKNKPVLPVVGSGHAPHLSRKVGEEESGMFDEEENTFVEKPKSGKGVKLGDIVTKTEFKKSGGQNSPMTYGDENLGEGPDDADFDGPEELEMGSPLSRQDYSDEMSQIDPDEALDMIATIKYMDSMGLSKAAKSYTEDQMAQMNPNQLKKYHSEVMGDVAEATQRTKTKTQDFNLDDMDDVLNPRQADLPATFDEPDSGEVSDTPAMSLPAASRDSTQNALRGMTPSDTMRNFMNRINPDAGAAEPDLPDTPTDALTIRTASDVPAVISSAMQAAGTQTPEWHNVNNLPGFGDRNVRGMGRQVFSMFTSTPLELIQTVANVEGQGPNTDAEIRAVAGWLRDNAEDLGTVDVSHGMAIPGYKPDVKEYRANGIRFHLVRDPMGQYIYAYPDADARLGGPPQGQGQLGGRGNMPRLRESAELAMLRPTLFEQLKWDEEVIAVLKETMVEEELLDESSLSKMLGKEKGGQNLVRWMHNKHKLSNEAALEPAPFSERLLWKEFKANPDNFVIVSATDGVAGIKPYEKFIKDRTAEFAKKGKQYNPSGDSTLPYQIIAFTDDGQQVDPALLRQPTAPGEEPEQRHPDPTVMKARMGKISGKDMQNPNNTFNLLADQIGPLKTVWVASGAVEREKMKGRADMKVEPEVNEMDAVTKIFKRVRPVLKTLGNQALSQINNRAKRYIDGGNFEGAQKIAASGNKLKQFLATIDTSGDVALSQAYGNQNKSFTDQIIKAVVQASGGRQGTNEYKDFLKRAANGGTVELKPVLDALRDSLVSLT